MSESALHSSGPGQYQLSGALTVANAATLRRAGEQAFGGERGKFSIDLANVAPIDSAGLALLIDWLAHAKASGAQLEYLHLPAPARTLARLSEVEGLLDPAAAASAST